MTELTTITAEWQGISGAPGYSKFRFDGRLTGTSLDAAGNAVHQMFLNLAQFMKQDWSVIIQSVAQVNDVQTGDLTAEVARAVPIAPVTGGAATTTIYSGGVGCMVRWHTGAIWNGRKVAGRTYLCPLLILEEANGTITAAFQNDINASAQFLVGAANVDFVIWARKMNKQVDPPVQIDGTTASVIQSSVPDRVTMLRTRRT